MHLPHGSCILAQLSPSPFMGVHLMMAAVLRCKQSHPATNYRYLPAGLNISPDPGTPGAWGHLWILSSIVSLHLPGLLTSKQFGSSVVKCTTTIGSAYMWMCGPRSCMYLFTSTGVFVKPFKKNLFLMWWLWYFVLFTQHLSEIA